MADLNLPKTKSGYGYKYTELAQMHDWCAENNIRYSQYIETAENGDDYMFTKLYDISSGKRELIDTLRGCKVIQVAPGGKTNDAQAQGSGITYARRYSLLMALGLATEDDDGASVGSKSPSKSEQPKQKQATQPEEIRDEGKARAELLKLINANGIPKEYITKLYNVDTLTDMDSVKLNNAIDHFEQIKAKYEKEKK